MPDEMKTPRVPLSQHNAAVKLPTRQTTEGWLVLTIPTAVEAEAQRIRAERDELYPNIFREEDTDMRWVGEVGEIGMYTWLHHNAPGRFEWITEKAAGRPDFLVD